MSTTSISTTLEEVQYENLLQISWIESRLAKNFKTIVDFLKQNKTYSQGRQAKTENDLAEIKLKASLGSGLEERLKNLENAHMETHKQHAQMLDSHRIQIEKLKQARGNQVLIQHSPGKVGSSKDLTVAFDVEKEARLKDLQQRLNSVEQKTSQNANRIREETERLKANYKQHEELAKDFDEKLKQELAKMAPELNNLLNKAKSFSDIEAKLQKISKMSNEHSDSKLLSMADELQRTKARLSVLENANLPQKFSKLHQILEVQESRIAELEGKAAKVPELNIEGELNILKDRLTDIEQMGLGQVASPGASTASSDSAANARMLDRINKLNMQILNLVTKEQHQKDVNALRDRQLKADRALQKESETNNERNEEVWSYLRGLVIPEQKDYDNKFVQVSEDINLKNAIVHKKYDQLLSRMDVMRKDLAGLKEECERLKNAPSLTTTTFNTTKLPGKEESFKDTTVVSKKPATDHSLDDLRKDLQNQIHDLKLEIVGIVRDLEKRLGETKSLEHDIINVLNKLDELRASLGKKADLVDTKKGLQFLEGKIYGLYNAITKEETSNDDARVARKNWFCLSCDKMLTNYAGKMGRTIAWDALPSRKLVITRKEELPNLK